MSKTPKKTSPSWDLYQFKLDLLDAMEALEHFDPQQMGFCDFETAANLEKVAELLEAAIDVGVPEAIGSYLPELAKLHRMRGKLLAPPPGFRGPRLEFRQRGKG